MTGGPTAQEVRASIGVICDCLDRLCYGPQVTEVLLRLDAYWFAMRGADRERLRGEIAALLAERSRWGDKNKLCRELNDGAEPRWLGRNDAVEGYEAAEQMAANGLGGMIDPTPRAEVSAEHDMWATYYA